MDGVTLRLVMKEAGQGGTVLDEQAHHFIHGSPIS